MIGGKRAVVRFPPRIVHPRVTGPRSVGGVRAVLRRIIDLKLNGGTNSPGFGITKGANATRISGKTNNCGDNVAGCLIDFTNCFPTSGPHCDYVIYVRGSNLPTSNNDVDNGMFRSVTRNVVTRDLGLSIGSTGSSTSVFIPSIGGKGILTTSCMLARLNVGAGAG